jgi:hypothetical protein
MGTQCVAARCQMRIFGHVAEGLFLPFTSTEWQKWQPHCAQNSGKYRNHIHADSRMLYRGDFVYTEELSDLRICRDHLLGKL